MAVGLTDERGMDVPVKTTDNQDGTFTVEYEPKTPGKYTVLVLFANKEVPQSPIKVQVEPNIDVSKVKVVGLEPSKFLSVLVTNMTLTLSVSSTSVIMLLKT